ncbi:MAG: molybdopterin molybdenumtransferase MoeA [Desulfobacteraceae bacterium A6]|nr:MAG: molybdopterin molybdenumtransferase MoeA [Desulfobacteraceae bacterium A6]
MKDFFKVKDLEKVLEYASLFPVVETELVLLEKTPGRILAEEIVADIDLPGFSRSTMDGYAVRASSTFGASEENPAYLNVVGSIAMGESPSFSVEQGETARISTGGMLPKGADSVVMIEHTEILDENTIEAYKSTAPGQNVIEKGEDFAEGNIILRAGQKIRPQETGLLAAFGKEKVKVFKKPVIGIISTGDEVVPVSETPRPGQIRDINTYSLSGQVIEAGGIPLTFGIVQDDYKNLLACCMEALSESDMVLISGGSSVGTRDYTIEILSDLPDSEIIVHGISISPGKPTILSRSGKKPLWGLPGHVVSAMIVFAAVVKPFIEKISGFSSEQKNRFTLSARLSRNVSSAQGRTDYIRVRLTEKEGVLWAEPILGKSGLINTMIKADGLIEIGKNVEGLEKGAEVRVFPL